MNITKPIAPDTLIERMIEIADRDDTTGLAADALREGSEKIEANNRQLQLLAERLEEKTVSANDGWCKVIALEGQLQLCREALQTVDMFAVRADDDDGYFISEETLATVIEALASIEGVGE